MSLRIRFDLIHHVVTLVVAFKSFSHPHCISTKFPLTLTPCQITAAAYDGQKDIFPYRELKWYSFGYSYYLLDSKVMYLSHAMWRVTSVALILSLYKY